MQHMKTLLKKFGEGAAIVTLGVAVILGMEAIVGALVQTLKGL